jgi:hypothetical protein
MKRNKFFEDFLYSDHCCCLNYRKKNFFLWIIKNQLNKVVVRIKYCCNRLYLKHGIFFLNNFINGNESNENISLQQSVAIMNISPITWSINTLYYIPLFIYAEMYHASVLGRSVYFTRILALVTQFIGSNAGKTISFRLFANTIYIYIYIYICVCVCVCVCGIYITCSSLRNSIDFVIFPFRMTLVWSPWPPFYARCPYHRLSLSSLQTGIP